MLSLRIGIDLLSGVHARFEDRHRSAEFIAFLEQLDDAAYRAATAIKPIRDNIPPTSPTVARHRHAGRFEFVFTPKHGS
jgi:hypothetical protein